MAIPSGCSPSTPRRFRALPTMSVAIKKSLTASVMWGTLPNHGSCFRDTERTERIEMAAVTAPPQTRDASPMRTAATNLGTQRWGRVLPVAFITYSLAYLDRSNYSIGIAGGMKEDLAITGGIASLIGALFFLGYF